MAYQPIQDYGIIGDMRTAALVGRNGSIDWYCLPRFDSPSVFGALLDDRKGGRFKIAPAGTEVKADQYYLPETNVLVTRFLSPEGVVEVTDFMPVGGRDSGNEHHVLIRQVRGVRGEMRLRMECAPAFNYARDMHETRIVPTGAIFASDSCRLCLWSQADLHEEGGGAVADFTVREDQALVFAIGQLREGMEPDHCFRAEWAAEEFASTVDYWRAWIGKSTYSGRWREMVHRSALVLKLLTYAPTGAIVSAPTAGLPENPDGTSNWDYRYTWIRDAAFTVYALIRIGFTDEAAQFMRWLEGQCADHSREVPLEILYGVDGRRRVGEEMLTHLEGYRGTSPVRIGHPDTEQLQLDIYGELMDAVYLHNKYGSPISYDFWRELQRLTDWVCDNWHRADAGMWAGQRDRRQYVYSKVMCWVAVDRALRLADKRSFPADRRRWLSVRDEIYEEVMRRGWNREMGSFVQVFDGERLDASTLIMPLVFFTSPTDPRMLGTLEAITRRPSRGGLLSNNLVYRYTPEPNGDGQRPAAETGTYNMCTFWLVEATSRAAVADRSRLDRARLRFERMLGYANHLGLYAEETSPTGEALGNFPHALTHLTLISAAFNLDRALGTGA